MAKTTLKPWRSERIKVEIETTHNLTKEDREKISKGIRLALARCFPGNCPPSLEEIKRAVELDDCELAQKIISRTYTAA